MVIKLLLLFIMNEVVFLFFLFLSENRNFFVFVLWINNWLLGFSVNKKLLLLLNCNFEIKGNIFVFIVWDFVVYIFLFCFILKILVEIFFVLLDRVINEILFVMVNCWNILRNLGLRIVINFFLFVLKLYFEILLLDKIRIEFLFFDEVIIFLFNNWFFFIVDFVFIIFIV